MAGVWQQGDAYERFMGRWSRRVSPVFLDWLGCPPGLRWADVGCGSGALTSTILEAAEPASVLGLDPAPAQVAEAERQVVDERASFVCAGAEGLAPGEFDVVVSGLVLNFVPDPVAAVRTMAAAAPAGTVAAYVWDYAEGMQLLRVFWDVVVALDPPAADLHEGHRFQIATQAELEGIWVAGRLDEVETTALTVPAVFRDLDDYWDPFLGGQGPAGGYVASLDEPARERLRAALDERLPRAADGSIPLSVRAWAVRGVAGSR